MERTTEGCDEIRRLVEERRNTAKGARGSKNASETEKNKTTRKDTADAGGIQRHQKYIMHKIWKEKNAYPEGKKTTRARQSHQKKVLQMSSASSTANFVFTNSTEKKKQDPENLETRRNTEKKSYNEEVRKTKHQSSHKKKYKLTLIASKNGRASDNNGIRAEDIKTCDETTKEMIRQIINDVLKQDDCTPKTWKQFL